MPVVFTFDFTGVTAGEQHHMRVRSMLERFGWENLGGTSYRYPKLGTQDHPTEDWLNHVVPALMFFRAYVLHAQITVSRFTLDTHSSTGCNPQAEYGTLPVTEGILLYTPTSPQFGEGQLRQWLQAVDDACPYPL